MPRPTSRLLLLLLAATAPATLPGFAAEPATQGARPADTEARRARVILLALQEGRVAEALVDAETAVKHYPADPLLRLLVSLQQTTAPCKTAAIGAKPPDERLTQAVTSRVVDFPLRAWLDQLGHETGVRLRVAPDYEDRAITVRVKSMPLGELIDAVASLYGDVWRPGRKKDNADYMMEASLARRNRQRLLLTTTDTRSDIFLSHTTMGETLASGEALLKLGEESRAGRPTAVFYYAPLDTTRHPGNYLPVSLPYRVNSRSGQAANPGAR